MPQTSDPTLAPESEQSGRMHGSALVGGAVAGVVIAAFLVGSFILLLTLAFGAALGAFAAGAVARIRAGASGHGVAEGRAG